MTKFRTRNILFSLGLAGLGALLVGIYVTSYRNSVDQGATFTNVLVAARDIPRSTPGMTVASSGYLKSERVPRSAVVPGAISSGTALASLVARDPIYQGEQVTTRQFVAATQGGIFATFSGTQRAMAITGDPAQLLAGTLSNGDRVDVIAAIRYQSGAQRGTAKVVLRNLLVLKAPETPKSGLGSTDTTTATLILTDDQAEVLTWTMRNAVWSLALRPTTAPLDSTPDIVTLNSILSQGLPVSVAAQLVAGTFSESLLDPGQNP